MNKDEDLNVSIVFAGLVRPAMIFGVTLDYLGVIFTGTIAVFIAANSIKYLLLYIPLHACGWLACKIDANIFTIISKKLSCINVPNKKIWGCQSYEPL